MIPASLTLIDLWLRDLSAALHQLKRHQPFGAQWLKRADEGALEACSPLHHLERAAAIRNCPMRAGQHLRGRAPSGVAQLHTQPWRN